MRATIVTTAMLTTLMLYLTGCAGGQTVSESALKSEDAVSVVLFDHEASEFTAYRIRPSGAVEVSFARDTPDTIYHEISSALREHPDIRSVRIDRSAPACGLF